jgi:methylmalonyl-CoA mutase N-terminal domain/subunit
METHAYDPAVVERQLARLKRVRADRDDSRVQDLLRQLQADSRDESVNLLPVTIELVKVGATMGDIVESLREVWGTYRETPVF